MKARPMPSNATTWQELLNNLEGDLRAVLSQDLAAAGCSGVYLLQGSFVNLERPCYGITHPRLARHYQDAIADRWDGNGPAAIIDDASIDADSLDFDMSTMLAAAVACHEASHWFEFPALCLPALPDNPTGANVVRAFLSAPSEVVDSEPASLDSGHGPMFVRRAIHIASRLVARGWRVPLVSLLCWELHYIASPWDIFHTLETELQDLQHMPIRALDTIPPPAAFLAQCDMAIELAEPIAKAEQLAASNP